MYICICRFGMLDGCVWEYLIHLNVYEGGGMCVYMAMMMDKHVCSRRRSDICRCLINVDEC